MARSRNIKPGFFKNEDLAECSPWARLCFAGLWTLADREGRLEDRPKRIKGELFPFDTVDVEPLLADLAKRGFITRYAAESRGLIQINEFLKHQSPHFREPKSEFPPPQSPRFSHDPTPPKPEALPSSDEPEAPDKPEALTPSSALSSTKSPSPTDSGERIPERGFRKEETSAPSVLVDRSALNGHGPPPGYRVPDCPYDELLALFHAELPSLPHIVVFNDARKTSLRARWVEVCAAEKFGPEEGLAWFGDFFRMLSHSAFLTGRAKDWKANFDWLTKPRNFAKAVEGNYQGQRQ